MKAKISRGNGFRGLLAYVFGPGDKEKHGRADQIGGNAPGKSPRQLASIFAVTRKLRPEVKNPVWHCSLSLPRGERLSDERWEAVCARHLQNLAIDTDKHLWTVVRHTDTDHDHVHIIASRIGLDGSLWHGRRGLGRLPRRHRGREGRPAVPPPQGRLTAH